MPDYARRSPAIESDSNKKRRNRDSSGDKDYLYNVLMGNPEGQDAPESSDIFLSGQLPTAEMIQGHYAASDDDDDGDEDDDGEAMEKAVPQVRRLVLRKAGNNDDEEDEATAEREENAYLDKQYASAQKFKQSLHMPEGHSDAHAYAHAKGIHPHEPLHQTSPDIDHGRIHEMYHGGNVPHSAIHEFAPHYPGRNHAHSDLSKPASDHPTTSAPYYERYQRGKGAVSIPVMPSTTAAVEKAVSQVKHLVLRKAASDLPSFGAESQSSFGHDSTMVPHLKDGYSRIIHSTTPSGAADIASHGLRYGAGNFDAVHQQSQGPTKVVMHMPNEELEQHRGPNAPGVVRPSRIVGVFHNQA